MKFVNELLKHTFSSTVLIVIAFSAAMKIHLVTECFSSKYDFISVI